MEAAEGLALCRSRLSGGQGEGARLDPARVRSILRRQFPEVDPSTIVILGEGCDSKAFEVDGTWVFRFPKRPDVERQLAIESRILAVLAERSPLELPVFAFQGEPCADFPHHFAGYRKLSGVPAIQLDSATTSVERWAPVLGGFLSWLHRVPIETAERESVPRRDLATLIEEVRTDALDDLGLLTQVIDEPPLERWRAWFEMECAVTGPVREPVLVHGDLAAEHVLCDPSSGRPTGILDWSEIAIGDPSIDWAGVFHWGGRSAVAAAHASYAGALDGAGMSRARFLAACRGVGDIAFGLERGRREYVEAGSRALHHCLGSTER